LSSSKVGGDRDGIIKPIIPREGETVSWGEKPGGIGIEGPYVPSKRSEREGCQEITEMRRNTRMNPEEHQVAKSYSTQETMTLHVYAGNNDWRFRSIHED
jgi:hypothetical protein